MSTSDRLDLSQIPLVDNHAHAMARHQPEDAVSFRANFTEAHDPALAREHVRHSVHYQWALRQLTSARNLRPDEASYLAFRQAADFSRFVRQLAHDANLAWLLLDEGYPPPELAYSSAEMAELLEVQVGRILRIETLLEDLIPQHAGSAALINAFDQGLEEARRAGFVAFKSIAAYRTGLTIEPVSEPALAAALRDLPRTGVRRLRLASKPIIDFFIFRTLQYAARHALPVQFHTGYGDPDLDLRLCNPLHLRPLLEEGAFVTAPIVLLHESFPFTAEAAYLAAAYPNAYVDVAFSLPPLSRGLLNDALRTALGTAPASKVMCSSDGTLIPEHYWLGAVRARLCLSDVLSETIDSEELDTDEAMIIARMVLHENAARIYHL